MKSIKLLLIFMLVTTLSYAQKSPKKQTTGKVGEVEVIINYGAPSVKGRKIWGKLVPYEKVWRAGANENTTISFSKNVTIDGNDLNAGTYSFFMIPNQEGDWIVIFNKKNDAWEAFSYDQKKDVMRLNSTPEFVPETQEQLHYSIGENTIIFTWEKVKIELFITQK